MDDKNKPLEFFFPRLVTVNAVKVALRKEFGRRASAIITKLKTHQPLSDEDLGAHDTIVDLVANESKTVTSLCWETPDPYIDSGYVNIMRYGTRRSNYVYWVCDEEFPDEFFGSMKAAKEQAPSCVPGEYKTWWKG
jgi:hypothetical protein